MLTLALDTTTRGGSVALLRPDGTIDCLEGDASRTHGERLPGEIVELLERNGVAVGDIGLYGVAAGPGSFTGLRIGIATVQGLALVHERPVVAVSAFEALADAALASGAPVSPDDLVGVWIDAHRQEVFSALFRCVRAGSHPSARGAQAGLAPIAVDEPAVATPHATLARWSAVAHRPIAWLIGDGATGYTDLVLRQSSARIITPVPPLAPAIARLTLERFGRGEAAPPHAVKPIYVRRPDAELARERRSAR